MTSDAVAVIGGGPIGLCTSLSLHRRGHEVVVLDAGPSRPAAAGASAGWITPTLSDPLPGPGVALYSVRAALDPASPLYVRPRAALSLGPWLLRFLRSCNRPAYSAGVRALAALNRRTLELFDDLDRQVGGYESRREGLLLLYLSARRARRALEALRSLGLPGAAEAAYLEGGALVDREPGLGGEVAAGIAVAGDRHVFAPRFIARLADHLRSAGVEIRSPATALGFDVTDCRVAAVETSTGPVGAGRVVVAAGAWTPQLTGRLGVALPIQAGKGYALDYAPAPVELRSPVHLDEAHVAVTPLSGMMRSAGTMELSGLSSPAMPRRIRQIDVATKRYLSVPAAARPAYVSSGLRPVTPDGLPVIGRLPGVANAFVAGGHALLGLTLGPATGEAIADLIDGRDPGLDLRPFDPARFARPRAPLSRRRR